MFLRLAYLNLLYILFPVFILVILYRLFIYKYPVYTFPAVSFLKNSRFIKNNNHKKILFFVRIIALIGLTFLIARPQWVDESSKLNVEGIDIVVAIDASDSMQLIDDLSDRLTRIEVAKREAIRFIEKRTNDPIGLVLFGKEALSRCPLTLDKSILKELVGQIKLGEIDPSGTWLGTGMATAVNRLRNSKAKSKVIILLTDGEPTQPEKVEPDAAIEMAKQFNIKIYTIGIGNEKGGYFYHPMFGLQQTQYTLNTTLLQSIADKTGGQFFKASNAKEMRMIYDKIDSLEKTKIESEIFHNYYEAFLTFIWIILALLGLEFLLRFFIWRGV
ncbi:MAG: von Willebrand factor type A [candidate division TM6 bacterium GW2011_GWF2_37_49]|nr:MAG: von Willebrand factor type A [candidate division TM6 bacterium GW2011_GWF2_37_49]